MKLLRLLPCIAMLTASQAASVEERLDQLEAELKTLREENAILKRQHALESGADHRTSEIKPAGLESTLSVGGFLQLQADGLDKGDSRFSSGHDRFYIRRARMNLAGKYKEKVDFRVELELAGSLSETSSYRAQATDAWVALDVSHYGRVRAGQFKTPFGYEQLGSDLKSLTIERSLANDRLTLNRQIGVQWEGELGSKLTYSAGAFNGTGTNTDSNDNDAFLWAARVATKGIDVPVGSQSVKFTSGINGYVSHDRSLVSQPAEFLFDSTPGGSVDNIFSGKRDGIGIDAQLRGNRAELWVEYLRGNFDQTNATALGTFSSEGWYIQGAYFVVPSILQAVLKYDSFDPRLSMARDHTETWTAGANWLIKGENIKLMTHLMMSDVPGTAKHQDKVLVRLQTVF